MNIRLLKTVFYWKNLLLITGIVLLVLSVFLYLKRGREGHIVLSTTKTVMVQHNDLYEQWKTFPGASKAENGVKFEALNRKIVNQDGSGGQPNPAVNVGGSRMQVTGDFNLTIKLSELSGGEADFRLYGQVPVIYDEWRHEGASLALSLNGDTITISQWDGTQESPVVVNKYTVRTGDNSDISLDRAGDKIIISKDGTRLATLPQMNLFENGTMWFGAQAAGDGFILNTLSINGNAKLFDTLSSQKQTQADSLAALASTKRSSLKIGAAVGLYPLMTDQQYRDIALNEFSMWTPENEMKAQFIHPLKDIYAFQDADFLVDTAFKNGIVVHGHALVFGEANAAWMQTTPAAQLQGVMNDHITTIMKHYAGKVAEWDVVNEPLDDYQGYADGLRRSIWYNAMGEDFIATALRTARAADPAAKLYINEYGLEADGERWEMMLSLIHKLQAAGVPLDGIGFQAHVYENGDEISRQVLESHITVLAKLGLLSRISEIDVHGEDLAYQTTQYGNVLSACLAQSTCTAFSTWGVSDAYGSTTSDHTYPLEYGNDLLWSQDFTQKNALFGLRKLLK